MFPSVIDSASKKYTLKSRPGTRITIQKIKSLGVLQTVLERPFPVLERPFLF